MKKKPKEQRDPAAVKLGKAGGKKRWANKTAQEKSEAMREIRNRGRKL